MTRILFYLLFLVLMIGLLSSSALNVFAQHKIPPENWPLENLIEMRKMVRNKGPISTIGEEVAALAGGDGKGPALRLVDRGPEALSAVHATLRPPEIGSSYAFRLLQVMGALAEKSSVSVVLELLKKDKKSPLRRDALYILALLPVTEESAAFIIEIANDVNENWNTRRMACTWFGFHRDPRGRRYAESLRSDPDPERRAAGLFVLARLGDKSVLEPVSQMLASGAPPNSRDALMWALADITTPEEFERRAPSSLAWSGGYKESLLYARYVASGPQNKIPLCLEMLRSQTPGHRELAVRYLLENGYASKLRPYAALDLWEPYLAVMIRNEIRKAGWRIIDTDDEFNIVRRTR
jgi:HEAT repeat protein